VDPSDICSCGHMGEAHEHYRVGTECSICRPGACEAFTRARRARLPLLRALVDVLQRRRRAT
jgi:hypothetical protein